MLSAAPLNPCQHGGVIHTPDDGVLMVGGGAVTCVEGVEQRAQHTELGGAGAKAQGCGCMMAHFNPLAATRQ